VWKAWTEPKHLARWWGPAGFTNTTRRIDVRPGAQWRFVMHGPDGRDYENLITYDEIVEPERIAYHVGGEKGVEPVSFRTTVTFEAVEGGRTKITMTSRFPSKTARDHVLREYGAGEGGRQHLARLADHVAEMGAGTVPENPLFLARAFDAPRALVWRAWTERERLAKWFGPKGVTIPKCTMDFRVGGTFHYCMRGPDGTEHWGKWVFREIVPEERLVFIVSFADASGQAIRAPFAPTWPLETLSTITFADQLVKKDATVVSVRWEPHRASADERRTFDEGFAGMTQGWTGTMESLTAYLAANR
jgi:uncharacterized protein YndB with AHSA1/START domain